MTYLLGTDIGTSSVKTVLLEVKSGRALVDVTREYPISQPRPGWAEQNPDDWWNAAVATIREAIARTNIDPNAVRAISLCGQMHGFVPVDKNSHPLHPAIIWADTRSSPQVDALNTRVPLAEMARYAPGPPAAGFMGPTLMWLAEHQPDLLAQTAAVLLPKDYVRLRMTDAVCTEPSDAAATWLFDVKT
ncbi:MAG: xylulokinase, partial [Burkholderiales bacterium]|nr:xylulokinase [Anaerolineae bacterium]